MKKVLFIINKKTETSIPLKWYEALSKLGKNRFIFKIADIKEGIKIILDSNILHLHHPKSAFIYSVLGKLLGKSTIYTIHGSYDKMKFFNKFCFIFSCILADKITLVNYALQEPIPIHLKYLIKNKLITIHNSIDVSNVKEIATINFPKVKKLYKIPNEKFIIFHPARFVPEKNHANILLALKQLANENNNFLCIFAGDGKLRKNMETFAEELGIKENVLFLKTIPYYDTLGIMKLADLFIMPSISEGLNTAFLEALALRKKIVISDIKPYIKFFEYLNFKPNDLNVYISNINAYSIYENILLALHSDTIFNEDLYGKLEQLIDIQKMSKKYFKIYNELIS